MRSRISNPLHSPLCHPSAKGPASRSGFERTRVHTGFGGTLSIARFRHGPIARYRYQSCKSVEYPSPSARRAPSDQPAAASVDLRHKAAGFAQSGDDGGVGLDVDAGRSAVLAVFKSFLASSIAAARVSGCPGHALAELVGVEEDATRPFQPLLGMAPSAGFRHRGPADDGDAGFQILN